MDEVDEAQGDSTGSTVDDTDATEEGIDMAGNAPDMTDWEDGLEEEEVEDYISGLGSILLEDGTFSWEEEDDDWDDEDDLEEDDDWDDEDEDD